MYRVTVDGVELEVDFDHEYVGPRRGAKPRLLFTKHRRTICMISASGRQLAAGFADCSSGDQFCRATGRKLALTRAVAELPKHVRKVIWDGYWRATARRINALFTQGTKELPNG